VASIVLRSSYASLPKVRAARAYLVAIATRPRLAASLRRLDLRGSRDELEHAKLALVLSAILQIARGVVAVTIEEIEEDGEWAEVVDALGGCARLRALSIDAGSAEGGPRSCDVIFARQSPWSALTRVFLARFDLTEAPGAEHWSQGGGPRLRSLSVDSSWLGDDFLRGFVAACSRLTALSITDSSRFGKAALVHALEKCKPTLQRFEFLGNILDSNSVDDNNNDAHHAIDSRGLVHLAIDADMLDERQWMSMRMSRLRSLFVDRPSAVWPVIAACAFGINWHSLQLLAFNRNANYRINNAICRVLKVRRPCIRPALILRLPARRTESRSSTTSALPAPAPTTSNSAIRRPTQSSCTLAHAC